MSSTGDVPLDLHALSRTRYFDGRLMTVADFEREQQYHREARYLHNRALGFGIVEGLDVSLQATGITVSPGFAIDGLGREIVLPEAVHLDVDDSLPPAIPGLAITATWHEELCEPLPVAEPDSEPVAYAAWLEMPVVAIEPRLTRQPGAVVLAGLTMRRRKGAKLDVTVRDGFRLRASLDPRGGT